MFQPASRPGERVKESNRPPLLYYAFEKFRLRRIIIFEYKSDMDEILDTKKAAARLGISERRVRELIQAGKIPATRVGRDWAILSRSLQFVTVYGKPGRPKKEAA